MRRAGGGAGTVRGVYRATGKEVDAGVAHVWTVEDGKLARFDQFTDTLQFAEVTGQRDREIRRRSAAV